MPYYAMKILNTEPLKIGATGDKSVQVEPSLTYIPGSTIRGAFINRLFSEFDYKECEKIELLTKIKFLNAYPCYIGDENIYRIMFPTPKNLRVDKHLWRKAKVEKQGNIEISNLLKLDDMVNNKNINNIEYSYVDIIDKTLKGMKVKKTYHLHHNTKRNQSKQDGEDRDNLFRYEAIDEGYEFINFIKIEDTVSEKLKTDLENLIKSNMSLSLGGSKTAGYGACKLEYLDNLIWDEYYDSILKSEALTPSTINFFALSDCILKDEMGNPTDSIEEYIKGILGEEDFKFIKLDKHIIDIEYSQGYNAKWQSRLPKEALVKAGSVWKYIWNLELDITDEKKEDIYVKLKNALKENLYGERIEDGFGWIIPLTDKYTEIEIKSIDKSENKIEKTNILIEKIFTNIDSNLKILLKGFSGNRIEWQIENVSKSKDYSCTDFEKINNNRIQNMIEILYFYKSEKEIEKNIEENIKRNEYMNNNKMFSFLEINFKEHIEYLKNPKECQNEKLDKWVFDKLNTAQGNLYYGEFKENKEYQKRLFLSEFLIELLKNIKNTKNVKGDGDIA